MKISWWVENHRCFNTAWTFWVHFWHYFLLLFHSTICAAMWFLIFKNELATFPWFSWSMILLLMMLFEADCFCSILCRAFWRSDFTTAIVGNCFVLKIEIVQNSSCVMYYLYFNLYDSSLWTIFDMEWKAVFQDTSGKWLQIEVV